MKVKTHLLVSSALLLAAAIATPALAADDLILLESLVPMPVALQPGMRREVVREMLDLAATELSPDLWVCFDFRARNLPTPRKATPSSWCFVQARVSQLRLVDGKDVRAFIARKQQKGKPPATAVA